MKLPRETAPINAFTDLHLPTSVSKIDAGRYGLAFLIGYYSGRPLTVRLSITPAHSQQSFRLEAHGAVTRRQKAYVELDADGNSTTVGDEITALKCQCIGQTIDVELTMIPHRTREDWFFLFCEDTQLHSSFDHSPVVYQTAEPENQPCKGTHFHVNSIAWLENYLQIDFELMDPEAEVTGIRLTGSAGFETVQWWTWHTPSVKNNPEKGWITPRKPPAALPSPRAMEQWGTAAAWYGHSIRALYDDLVSVANMTIQESDRVLEALRLEVAFSDGRTAMFEPRSPIDPMFDPFITLVEKTAHQHSSGKPKLVELGARGASSATLRTTLEPLVDYLGVDIHPDPNVDLVLDVHRLSSAIDPESVHIVYSNSVLEHILAPWKVILECNAILSEGGLFIAIVPVTCALHAEPWDYWRISPHAWPAMLNRHTGFEIISTYEIGQVAIVPLNNHSTGLSRMPHDPSPIYGMVVARKIGPASAEWIGYSADLAAGRYDA